MNRSFLVVLRDSVDLVCFCSKDSRSCRLDIHPERGNSLVRLVYSTNRANLSSLICGTEKVVLCTVKRVAYIPQPFLFAGLIIDTDRLICLFASTILNWLVTHLFNSLSRPKKLRELKHLAWLSQVGQSWVRALRYQGCVANMKERYWFNKCNL